GGAAVERAPRNERRGAAWSAAVQRRRWKPQPQAVPAAQRLNRRRLRGVRPVGRLG
ncbi:unnamed protein product, partial [Effrenium voratum]